MRACTSMTNDQRGYRATKMMVSTAKKRFDGRKEQGIDAASPLQKLFFRFDEISHSHRFTRKTLHFTSDFRI